MPDAREPRAELHPAQDEIGQPPAADQPVPRQSADTGLEGAARSNSDTLDLGVGADLAAAYAELQGLLLDRSDVTEFLHQVAALTASVLPGSSCGITLRRDHQVVTIAQSDELAAAVDELQYGRGVGPCLEALHTGEVVSAADLVVETRWGDWRVHALTFGVRSSLSIPLAVDGETRGALNLYDTSPNSFGASETSRGEAFARQASVALTIVLRNLDQTVLEHQLRDALATRAVVDQAVGIIMGQRRIGSTDAFAVLRAASQARNRKLRDVAADLIHAVTGHPPRPPRPFAEPR